MSKQYREWYLNPVAKYRCEVNEDGIGLSGNEVHVIEKAAVDELRDKANKLIEEQAIEIQKLKTKTINLLDALAEIASINNITEPISYNIANETLKMFENINTKNKGQD